MSEEVNNSMPTLPSGQELEALQEGLDFLPNDQWASVSVEPYRLDFEKSYSAPRYTMSWKGIPFAPLGGIHAITGQAGNGKTMTLAQFMAAILSGSYGNLKYELSESHPHPRVLYVDTEMEEANTIAVKNRVMSMCERDIRTNYDDFVVVMLREVTDSTAGTASSHSQRGQEPRVIPASVMRWRIVLKSIWQYKPTIVFIDGLLDVVADFNDNTECQEIIYKCMQIASHYDISVWCVVHQNPGREKLVGHLGSFIERKVTDVFQTQKDKEAGQATFTVSQKKARGRDTEDWQFRVLPVDGWGRPEQVDGDYLQGADNPAAIKQWLEQVRTDLVWPATAKDIKEAIKKAGFQKNDPKLQADITVAKNRRFLIEQPRTEWVKGQKYTKFYLNKEEFNDGEDMPF